MSWWPTDARAEAARPRSACGLNASTSRGQFATCRPSTAASNALSDTHRAPFGGAAAALERTHQREVQKAVTKSEIGRIQTRAARSINDTPARRDAEDREERRQRLHVSIWFLFAVIAQ
jgi:hypothetical protein